MFIIAILKFACCEIGCTHFLCLGGHRSSCYHDLSELSLNKFFLGKLKKIFI
ncbi:hypothetical protein THIOM_000342 [Candidatus Thiomargarita nelsonii]|uniref:Uncharacterized protein n=1 Tax=Candidatus Thiomargarita nelsonii TaxID=1003181 RepID=A0A176S6V4_9GAMM|nr:hypothetical protein THIOM_000342 [Candidatus Thiomargarita nelsonii]